MNQTVGAGRLIGASVYDQGDERIGEVQQVYVDAVTERPEWVGVSIGGLDAEVLVPLEGADWHEGAVRAWVTRASARCAPAAGAGEPPTPQEQDSLLRHYGIPRVCPLREDIDLADLQRDPVSYSVPDRVPAGGVPMSSAA